MSCYSVSSVIYNSYLPIISQADPSVLALKSNAEYSTSLHGQSALTDSIENVISRLSSIGFIFGNMGSIAASVIVPSIIYVYAGPQYYIESNLFITIWSGIFFLPCIFLLKLRPDKQIKSVNLFIYSWKTCEIFLYFLTSLQDSQLGQKTSSNIYLLDSLFFV